VQLRAARASDAAAIAALHAASWRACYRGALNDAYLDCELDAERGRIWTQRLHEPAPNQYVVVVADQDGRLQGFACAYLGSDPEWGTLLDNMHVAAGLQRRGVGGRLMRSVASRCLAAGSARMYLWVLESNECARRFYERHGAALSGTDVWTPPGGGSVARCRYAWRDVRALARGADA
jgi:GNAT superfamily N-acetyltransferase